MVTPKGINSNDIEIICVFDPNVHQKILTLLGLAIVIIAIIIGIIITIYVKKRNRQKESTPTEKNQHWLKKEENKW